MTDYYEYAIPQLVKLLGARFKDYRLRSNMTQKEVSEQSGLTVTTIHKFESGAADNISLATFLLLLKAIGEIEALDDLLPELPPSPYLIRKEKKVHASDIRSHGPLDRRATALDGRDLLSQLTGFFLIFRGMLFPEEAYIPRNPCRLAKAVGPSVRKGA